MRDINIEGNVIINGPFDKDVILKIIKCNDIIVNGDIAGDLHITAQGYMNANTINASQNIVTEVKYTLGFSKWIKGLLK